VDSSSNSFDVAPIFPVDRIADRNSAQWRQQQQSLRRKSHLQNLARALQHGDLEQARQALDLLASDEPELGQLDITAKLQFKELGKALLSGDLAGARAAFSQLQSDARRFATRILEWKRARHGSCQSTQTRTPRQACST
jgi:hypothetical protein